MLRRFLDFQLALCEKKKSLSFFRPFASALHAFCYETGATTTQAPFIRDGIDVKRWMVLVLVALLPTIFMAIWNTGLQALVYTSGDLPLLQSYLDASTSFKGYWEFVTTQQRYLTILTYGSAAFFPLVLISYGVGGLCEGVVAAIRGHEIAEGFLVTGILYPLVLPPTIPYWMAALGILFGVLIGKELFGGTGMNIFNPALTARAFLFFSFPGQMTGDVWVGTNTYASAQSLQQINAHASPHLVDGYTQATVLQGINHASDAIKQIHVDAIASNTLGSATPHYALLHTHFDQWNQLGNYQAELGHLTHEQLRLFVTSPFSEGGLALAPDQFLPACHAADAIHGLGHFSDGNLFWGNMLGSMGETSTFACLLGAIFLVYTGIAAWRTMAAFGIGAFLTAYLFHWFSTHTGAEGGAWNVARFAMPAYRHLLMGGLAFGLVFMATEPVTSPAMRGAKWVYGLLIGMLTILIRLINRAYPEGVMLAILFGNVSAPLLDYIFVRCYRRRVTRARRPT